jgi:hypothetical protein
MCRLRPVRHSEESIFIIEYLSEYEFIFETTLAHEAGDTVVLFAEKNEGRKSRGTVPLIYLYTPTVQYFLCKGEGGGGVPYAKLLTEEMRNF